jgi:hypothetical protein
MIGGSHEPDSERKAMTDEERTTEGNEVEAQPKKYTPRSDGDAGDPESEVEEHGYVFPDPDGTVRHPETPAPKAGADSDGDVEEDGTRFNG